MTHEVAELEAQAAGFARHARLQALREAHAGKPGLLAAPLVAAVRRLCSSAHGAPVPPGGIGAVDDPVLLALLDVGLLVPKWAGDSERLVLPNRLARSVLLAWAEALCAELRPVQRLQCRWFLWRQGLPSERVA